jgi:hypothetical protein
VDHDRTSGPCRATSPIAGGAGPCLSDLLTSSMTEHWAATFVCNYRRSFRQGARPPQVRTSAFAARVALRDRLTRGLHLQVDAQLGAQTKAPTTGALPNCRRSDLQAATLVGLDLQDPAGARNRDRPRLHRLWDLAHEVDLQEPVVSRTLDLPLLRSRNQRR